MKFSDQPPSEQWAALKYRGETLAEVWFKPEVNPFALTFRIPQKTFQIPGVGPGLTTENLLKSVGVAAEEVESWRHGDRFHSGLSRSDPRFKEPLPQPPSDTTHLNIYVSLKPPQQVAATGGCEPETKNSSLKWQDLEARWNAILGMETSIDTLRLTMEGVRMELEALWKKALTPEERLHARRDDVARWNGEKRRIHFVLPKLKEFVHRATWAVGAPERKMLDEYFKDSAEPALSLSQMVRVGDQLENLLKDRQILSAQGVTVHHECRSIATNIQESLRMLQSNAAANKDKKKRAGRGSKFFKDVRRMSGLE